MGDAIPSFAKVVGMDRNGTLEMNAAYLHTSRTFPPPIPMMQSISAAIILSAIETAQEIVFCVIV